MTTCYTQRFQQLAQQWNRPSKRLGRLDKQQLISLANEQSTDLQAKLAASPYAHILASPMRYCTYHRKHYPSDLLMRFGIGIHPVTNRAWGFPTIQPDQRHERTTRGYYVKLNSRVLHEIQRKEYKRLFRGQANYAPEMTERIERLMMQSLLEQANTVTLTPVVKDPSSPSSYQCVLLLSPPPPPPSDSSDALLEGVDFPDYVPTYPLYLEQKWKPLYDLLSHHKNKVLAVPKSIDTVPFAIDLFRYHQLIQP